MLIEIFINKITNKEETMITKYSKLKRFLLVALVGLFAMTAGFGIIFANQVTVSADEYELVINSELKETYYVGEKLNVPSATFSQGTSNIDADFKIVYPNGTIRKLKEIDLTTQGTYSLVYSANIGGQGVIEEIKFDVVQKLFEGNQATCDVKYTDYTFVEPLPKYDNTTETGIVATVPAGAQFIYNKVIDLTKLTKDDILFDGNVISSETFKYDFMNFHLRLTDIYNASNYVELKVMGLASDKQGTYVSGTSSAQGAFQSNASNTYGVYTYVSMSNCPYNTYNLSTGQTYQDSWGHRLSEDRIRFSFDYATQTMYANHKYDMQTGLLEIISLKNTSKFTAMWDGFTTGECYLSAFVTGTDSPYESTQKVLTGKGAGTFFVRSVGGDVVSEPTADNFSFVNNVYKEEVEPLVQVDMGEYANADLPKAVVGYSYPVFPATAQDAGSGLASFTTNVYFGYNTVRPSSRPIVNGKFTPNYPGNYTIEYKAVDGFGNTTIETVDVVCVANQGFNIQLAEDASIDGLITGHTIKVKTPRTINHSGSSNISAVAKGTDNNGNPVEVAIDMEELTFIPMFEGEWTIEYTAKDYVGREVSASYDIEIALASKPVFIEGVSFIKNYVQGYSYYIPSLNAYDFIARKEVSTKIYYKEGADGEAKPVINNNLVPSVTPDCTNYDLHVWYEASLSGDTTVTEKLEYVINAVNAHSFTEDGYEYLDRNKLFITGENVTAGYKTPSAEGGVLYADYTLTADDYIEFINPVPAVDFEVFFYILQNGFDKLVFTLTDKEDALNAISLTVEFASADSVYVTPSGGLTVNTKAMNFNAIANVVSVTYNYVNKSFSISNSDPFAVVDTIYGEKFKGFNNNEVYFKLEVVDVESGKTPEFLFNELCKFSLFELQSSYTPKATVKTTMNFIEPYYVNRVYTIEKAVVRDLVASGLRTTLTVQDPAGNVITDVNGLKLENVDIDQEYQVEFDQYGNYLLLYKVPYLGMVRKVCRVIDVQPPVISFGSEIKANAKVGEKITFNTSAVDESGLPTEIFISVFDSGYVMKNYKVGEELTFEKAGKYTIIVMAYDANKNCTIERFEVKVK